MCGGIAFGQYAPTVVVAPAPVVGIADAGLWALRLTPTPVTISLSGTIRGSPARLHGIARVSWMLDDDEILVLLNEDD
jgi:hypothetical protein